MYATVTILATQLVAPFPYQYTVKFCTSLATLPFGEGAITIQKFGKPLQCNSGWGECLLFSKNAQTGSGVHTDSYSIGNDHFLTGDKAAGV